MRTYVTLFDGPSRYYAPKAVGVEIPNALLSLSVLPGAKETMDALCAKQTK